MDAQDMTSQPRFDSGTSGSSVASTETTATAREVERLRAERDAAVAALGRRERRVRRGAVGRRIIVGVFVVLFAVLVPVTATATWAHRTVLNTDQYVSTVTPIASDPAVTAAVSRRVTNQLYDALDPQAVIADALPPKATFLAGPIANGAKDAVQQAVDKVLSSSQFQQMWIAANRFAHAQLVAVLRGESTTLQTTNGQVVLNLVPLLNEALANAQGFVSGVVGKPVTLPTVTGDELPSAVCQRIATALDRPVPATCGQIALFPAEKLNTARRLVQVFDRAVLALLIVTPLLAVAALWVSRRRRRTLLQLTIGAGLGLVIVRRVLMWEQSNLVAAGRPENKNARSAIVHGVLNGFFDLTMWLLVGALVIVALALVTGPYRWAVATRRVVADTATRTGHLVVAGVREGDVIHEQDRTTVAWVRHHLDLLRVAGVVVAVVLLLAFSVNVWGFLVIAALLALYEVWLYRLRPPKTIVLPPSANPPAPRPKPQG